MRSAFILIIALACGLPGCGGSPTLPPLPKDAPTVGPHQGPAYALPDGLGYAEFANDPKADERDRTAPTALVVYFLKSDAKTSLTPPPTDVKFQAANGRRVQAIDLKPTPKADDPAGESRFASQAGPYRLEELRGDLTAKAGATPVKLAIAGAR